MCKDPESELNTLASIFPELCRFTTKWNLKVGYSALVPA